MALTWPHLLQFPSQPLLAARTNYVFFSDLTGFRSPEPPGHDSLALLRRSKISVASPPALKPVNCLGRSTEEKPWSDAETVVSASDEDEEAADDNTNGQAPSRTSVSANGVESQRIASTSSGDSLSLGIREPVYEVCSSSSSSFFSFFFDLFIYFY